MASYRMEAKEFYDFLTGKVYTAISRRLQRNLRQAGIGITSEQWSVLYVLWEEEGITQQELAGRTFREKTALTRLISNLERDGLVIRKTDPDDRRINLVYLTDKGRQIEPICKEAANQTLAEALVNVDLAHIEAAKETLGVVFQNLI